MQINFLKKVVEDTAGIQATKIVDLLYGKKDINEFLIAKKLGITINQTRNLLYRLSHLGIISSTRKKDKRKGWYIYFWTFNVLKSLEVLENGIREEIKHLQLQLNNKQTKRFYKCKICGREVNEESSLLTNFICSECGEVYELADNSPAVNDLTKKILRLQKETENIRLEINEEKLKASKKLAKTIRRDEKKKKETRKKMRKIAKRARDKLKKADIGKKAKSKNNKKIPNKKKKKK